MLNSGTSGFRHAPISKALVLLTASASVLVSISNTRSTLAISQLKDVALNLQLWKIITNQLFFSSPGEVMFGVILLYCFRIFERQMGSAKYAVFVLFSLTSSLLIQLAYIVTFPNSLPRGLISGPYALIFAHFVQYYSSIPSTGRFRLFALTLTEKIFMYMLGAQLIFAGGYSATIAALSGLAAGVMYRADALPLKHMVMPPPVAGACKRFVSPLLESGAPAIPRGRTLIAAASAAAAAAGQQQQPHAPLTQQQLAQALAQAQAHGAGNPLLPPAAFPQAAAAPSEENINALIQMGFSREVAVAVLMATNNDLNMALNSLLEN